MCRRHLSFFVREMWDVIINEELVWNWHMDVLCDEIQAYYEPVFMKYKKDRDGNYILDGEGNYIALGRDKKLYDYLIINIPPGTSKSTIVSVMAPCWSWTRDASLRHLTASYSGGLSTELAVKSRDIIRSHKYMTYFPYVEIKADEDGKTNYKTINNGQRYATSVGGTATGIHAHIKTIDDPLNPKQAASIVELAEANKWNDSTFSTRNVDKSVTISILIMQRLATNDLTGYILEKAKQGLRIRHVCLPATISKNVKPAELALRYINGYLDPKRLDQQALKVAKIDLGSAQYAGQFDQSPVPPGGLIWKEGWFIGVPDENFPDKKFLTQYGTDWDLAYTDDDSNSACAYVTAGKLKNNIFIDAIDWEWNQFPQLISWMKKQVAPHYIEAKASGKSAKQTLVRAGINAIEVKVTGGDKVARTNMATPTAEAGRVYVRKSILDRLLNDHKQGILFFPKGSHTDLNDAFTQCLQRLDKKAGSVDVSGGGGKEQYDEDDDY